MAVEFSTYRYEPSPTRRPPPAPPSSARRAWTSARSNRASRGRGSIRGRSVLLARLGDATGGAVLRHRRRVRAPLEPGDPPDGAAADPGAAYGRCQPRPRRRHRRRCPRSRPPGGGAGGNRRRRRWRDGYAPGGRGVGRRPAGGYGRAPARTPLGQLRRRAARLRPLPPPRSGRRSRRDRAGARPGGVLGITTWGTRPRFAASDGWDDELAAFGAGPDPDDTPDRDDLMDTPEKLAWLLGEAGFAAIRVWSERFAHRWEPESLFAQRTGWGSYQRRLATLDPAARDRCLARIRERLAGLSADDFVYRPEIVFAVGRHVGTGQGARPPPRHRTTV